MAFEGESPDLLHLEGFSSPGLPVCAYPSSRPGHWAVDRAQEASTCGHGWQDADSYLPRTPPSHPARPNMGGPRHACTHVQQGTHMLISGSPRCKRLGAGGFEHSESRLLPKSIGILSPPGPHLRLWRSQQQVRIPTPPQLAHIGPPPFPQPQPAAGAGGLLPPVSLPAPLRIGAQLLLPSSMGEERAYVWVRSLPPAPATPSTRAAPLVGSKWPCDSPGGDEAWILSPGVASGSYATQGGGAERRARSGFREKGERARDERLRDGERRHREGEPAPWPAGPSPGAGP